MVGGAGGSEIIENCEDIMTLHLHLARCRTPPVPTYTCLLHASPHPTTSARAINEPSQSFTVPGEDRILVLSQLRIYRVAGLSCPEVTLSK